MERQTVELGGTDEIAVGGVGPRRREGNRPSSVRGRSGGGRALLAIAGPAVLALGLACGSADAQLTRRVVFLVIDGPRDQEFLEHPTHAYTPRIWNELRPQGYISHAFHNLGVTQTVSGHASILTGTTQAIPDDGSVRPTRPTLWEYYRDATGAGEDACFFASFKQKLLCVSYSSQSGYGAADSARAAGPIWVDAWTVEAWLADAAVHRPIVSAIFLGQTDTMAHGGDWNAYIASIRGADSLAAHVWNWIQGTPHWADQTALFITADHGRHDTDWVNHGDGCPGCRHVPLVALGPDFLSGVEASGPPADLWDLCRTAGALLGIPTPLAEGRILVELFADPESVRSLPGATTPLRLEVRPQPASGPATVRLGGALAASWTAEIYDPSGRRLWSARVEGSDLARGIRVPPPPRTGSTLGWLRLRGDDDTRATARIVWVR